MDAALTLAVINSAAIIYIACRQEQTNRKLIKEKEQENEKPKVSYNTEGIPLTDLQQTYSMHVQKVKDQLRILRKNISKISPPEREKKIAILQEEVITQYAHSRYHYNNTQEGKLAHRIKIHLLETLLYLEAADPDLKRIDVLLELITSYQLELDYGIKSEIQKRHSQFMLTINKN